MGQLCFKLMSAERKRKTQTFILYARWFVSKLNDSPLQRGISVYCCGFIHPLSNQYVSNHSVLLESCRWIYGPVLCVTRAGCRMWMTLVALCQTLLSFSSCLCCYKYFRKEFVRLDSQVEDFPSGNGPLNRLSFPLHLFGIFYSSL